MCIWLGRDGFVSCLIGNRNPSSLILQAFFTDRNQWGPYRWFKKLRDIKTPYHSLLDFLGFLQAPSRLQGWAPKVANPWKFWYLVLVDCECEIFGRRLIVIFFSILVAHGREDLNPPCILRSLVLLPLQEAAAFMLSAAISSYSSAPSLKLLGARLESWPLP